MGKIVGNTIFIVDRITTILFNCNVSRLNLLVAKFIFLYFILYMNLPLDIWISCWIYAFQNAIFLPITSRKNTKRSNKQKISTL